MTNEGSRERETNYFKVKISYKM